MSDLWSLQIKGNTSAIFAPLKTLKLSNATLGSDVVGEDGRTVVLLTHDSVASEDGCELAQSVPIFSLTPIKNEHRCLDIILIKDQNYTFKAQGPNDVHLFGYSLAAISLPYAMSHLTLNSSDDVSSTGSSASATTISSVDSIVSLKRKGSTISARDSQIEKRAKASYLFKDVRPGPESNQQAVRGSVVTVDVKATWKSLDSKKRILFKEDKVKLLLDGSKERGWKSSIAGMRTGGERHIKVPTDLATGDIETRIDSDFTVEVFLHRVHKA
ncbi:hypothetical protein B0H15DRAFT_957252 [Mycena belliarum]|uniref:Uncharacterized protein n=1 Tax=Mycena belliarum TaxID=1033014 RepID=A0AAD6TMN7_9AGAR|nr:hypothetical protein B0H15DRAFT_957252 [Mycena belliae]